MTCPSGDDAPPVVVADLSTVERTGADGVLWKLPRGADLNANLVRLGPGGAIAGHTNDEVDVLLVGVSGHGVVTVDEARYELREGTVVAIPKHRMRAIASTDDELLYLSVHVARSGPQIAPRPAPA